MEKYGVDEKEKLEKLGQEKPTACPACGSVLEQHGNILVCPECGTKPFEKGDE